MNSNSQANSLSDIKPNTQGIFRIDKATWVTFKNKAGLSLVITDNSQATGNITILYRDLSDYSLMVGYNTILQLLLVLRINKLHRLCLGDDVFVCPELINKTVGLYVHDDAYFNERYGKVYHNLAITAVYDATTKQLHDDVLHNRITTQARHDYYYNTMIANTNTSQHNIKEAQLNSK